MKVFSPMYCEGTCWHEFPVSFRCEVLLLYVCSYRLLSIEHFAYTHSSALKHHVLGIPDLLERCLHSIEAYNVCPAADGSEKK